MANTILMKEIDYQKHGKINLPKLLKSLLHSLRLEDENFNWDLELEKNNDYGNVGKSKKERLEFYENLKNQIEILTEEKNSTEKKDMKKINNLKNKIKKRYGTDKTIFLAIDKFFEKNNENDIDKLFESLSSNYNYYPEKDFQKNQAKEQLLNYYNLTKDQNNTYKNQTIMKEVIFKIPVNNTGKMDNEDKKNIKEYIEKMYPNYNYEIIEHNDESNKHFHVFIQGWNSENEFKIVNDTKRKLENVGAKFQGFEKIYTNLSKNKQRRELGKLKQHLCLKFLNTRADGIIKYAKKSYASEEEKEKERDLIKLDSNRKVKDRKYNAYTLKLEQAEQEFSLLRDKVNQLATRLENFTDLSEFEQMGILDEKAELEEKIQDLQNLGESAEYEKTDFEQKEELFEEKKKKSSKSTFKGM